MEHCFSSWRGAEGVFRFCVRKMCLRGRKRGLAKKMNDCEGKRNWEKTSEGGRKCI